MSTVETPRDDGFVDGSPAAARLRATLSAVEVVLAAFAVLGAGIFIATLTLGRTALFWPSAAWVLVAAGTVGVGTAAWWLAIRVVRGTGWGRYGAAGRPLLALLPAALAGLAVYFDDASNHMATVYLPAKQSLLAYAAVLFVAGQVSYWLTDLFRRRAGASRPVLAGALPPVLLGVALAIYLNASVYAQWLPSQIDLGVNLDGARQLLAGETPYHDAMPVWANRVHLLPATLVLLFGPLAVLPDQAARLAFFLGNQVLWLLAMWLLVRQLAPEEQRPLWLAAALVFGATYWPWQESIRFGQQDGLLILLFVLSITAAARARDVVAGIALGLALIVKPLSIWLPLIYLI
ncbi:MAG: glycosyltransferase 87 family protein, partial [Chloroflexota bacterium]